MSLFKKSKVGMGLTVALFTVCQAFSGLLIDYDASVFPDDGSLTNPFSRIQFGGTSYTLNGGELMLTTAPIAGVWFGNGNPISADPTNWSVANNAAGNYLKVRMKLTPGSNEWSAYLGDGARTAGFGFHSNSFTYGVLSGGSSLSVTNTLDLTSQFHTFEFLLKDGNVTYRLDESQVLYHGPANTSAINGLLVIGDGSGSTPTGYGSMVIDHVTYEGAPAYSIPEPATLGLLGIFGGTLLFVRRSVLI